MIITGKKILVLLGGVLVLLASLFVSERSSILNNGRTSVNFLDIGQGDAALIRFEDGQTMLVDCGQNSGILSALGRHLGFFERNIDYLVVTHPDLDHYGGCVDVLERYVVKKIFVNGQEKKNDAFFEEWKRLSGNISTEVVNTHRKLNIASSSLEFFSPDPDLKLQTKEDSNNFSIVFRLLTGNGRSYLFMGDAEETLEKKLVEKYCSNDKPCDLSSDVLKVGHHGSDGSSSENFLARVKPSVAVISVGKNKFGHPTLRAIRHLERVGAVVRRTDKEGDMEI
jgi:competence protein ComEC